MTTIDLTPALSGERRETHRRAGRLSYYVAGEGAPLLLIHSVNAAASAYEMRPIHERMKATRRVYTVDLPGYGFSDRSERTYDIACSPTPFSAHNRRIREDNVAHTLTASRCRCRRSSSPRAAREAAGRLREPTPG